VNDITRQRLFNGKRRIAHRLRKIDWSPQDRPMMAASNIHYEVARRDRGLVCGGIGVMHLLARRTGLIRAIDDRLHLLKVHLPYHESDHVLNIAYNILAGGTCLEDIEHLRNNEVYLDGLAAKTIPAPTTAGDFCRRFAVPDVVALMEAINEVRLGVWRRQPKRFFQQATIDADGTLATTYGECKEGMDISYKGQWGYHPLVISLANTGEPLYLVNRSGNRPSHEGARRVAGPGGRAVPSGGVQEHPAAWRHGLHADGETGRLGRCRGGIHFRHRRDAQSGGDGERVAPKCMETAGSRAEIRGQNRTARPAGECQRADRPGAGV
jgi:hypothetical protein